MDRIFSIVPDRCQILLYEKQGQPEAPARPVSDAEPGDAQESEVRTFIKEIRRYAAIEKLDEVVLNRLISKILIGEVKKVDGQKVQKVRIVYNFVGEIPEIAA